MGKTIGIAVQSNSQDQGTTTKVEAMPPFYKQVAANTIYLLAGSAAANLFLFLSNILMARLLDPADYGLVTLVISINSLFFMVADMGVATAVTKLVAEDVGDRERTVRLLVSALRLTGVFSLIAMVLLVTLSPWLSRVVFRQDMTHLLMISSVWIVCSLFSRVLTGVFNGFQHMEFSLINSILFNGSRFLALIITLCLSRGVTSIVVGFSLAYIAALVPMTSLFLLFLKRKNLALKWVRGYERHILRYGVYLTLPFLGIYLTPYLLNMLVGWLSAVENVAHLSISLSLASLSFVVLAPVSTVLLAATSKAFADGEWQRISVLARFSFRLLWIFSLSVLFLLAFFGDRLIVLLYGAEYAAAQEALVIMAFAVFFESAKMITDPLLNGTEYARTVTWIELAKFALICVLGSELIYLKGILGAGIAILIAYSVSTALKIYQVRKRLDIDLISPAIEFVPLVIALAAFVRFDLPAWLFALLAVAFVFWRGMIPIGELRKTLSLLINME
jgi:O-antigen/teichoic acid export membrane protein